MSVKEIPTNYRVYYKSMKDTYTQLRDQAIDARKDLVDVTNNLWNTANDNIDTYKNEFDVDLLKYDEFKNNVYTTGTFLKLAKGLFINRKNNYLLVSDLFDLYNLALKQKELYEVNKDIKLYDKILALKLSDYRDILRTFYTEVHKHIILNGEGYVFEGHLGWTCVNRCHIEKQSPHINYAATKKRKAELEAQGIRIYNKEEAEWCKQNGIEYNAVDPRVYMNNEYCYEIPLISNKLENGSKYKLEIADYRNQKLRGLSNEEIAKLANNDIKKVCELPLDLRTKLNICNSIDKTLYINFIRNENQEPIIAKKADRKNR